MILDYRSIPVEVLRDFARVHSEMTSIRATADEVGVSHSALHKFITARTDPQPRVRRLLGLWYLEKQKQAPVVDLLRPYNAALAVLLSGVPASHRPDAEAEAVAALCSVYEQCAAPLPHWLEVLHAHWQRHRPHWMDRAARA